MASIDKNMNLILRVLLNGKRVGTHDDNGEFKKEDLEKYILSSEHYSGEIETIDYIQDKLADEQFEGYLLGNVIKYLSRYNNKGKQIKDIRKALTYLVWLIDNIDEKAM